MSERFATLDPYKVIREDLIYLAGLIDGDGCFFISKRTKLTAAGCPQYMMKLQIHCINEQFIDKLHHIFGGVKITNVKRPPRSDIYGVEFTGNLLTQMCELLIPFLRLKKINAENMLEMRRTYNGIGGRHVVPKEILHIRNLCFLKSRQISTHKPRVLPPCCPSALSSEEIQVN